MKRLEGKIYKSSISIFTLDYLENSELTDSDLGELFNKSGVLSLCFIVGMHRFIGNNETPRQIIDKCKQNENWYKEIKWTKDKRNQFRNKLINVYKNVYYYGPERCAALTDMWLTNFGFSLKNR